MVVVDEVIVEEALGIEDEDDAVVERVSRVRPPW